MKAAVLLGKGKVAIEDRPIPSPKANEVLLKIQRVGVCGSDVHYYTHGRIGQFVVKEPLILGHEASATVAGLGRDVKNLSEGDRVAIEPGYTCRTCRYCKSGLYNLCPEVVFLATPPVDGAFCQYLAWPADFVFKVPEAMTFDQAAMMEPTAVALWSCRRAPIQAGASVAVFGAGPIGAMTIQVARALGAATIIAVDLDDWRLEQAERFGARYTINARRIEDSAETIRTLIQEQTGEPSTTAGVDVAFETAGAVATTRAALASVRPAGSAMLVGLPPDPQVALDIVSAASRELQIKGQFRYANCYPPSIALAESGAIDPGAIVTHHLPLEKAEEALQMSASPEPGTLKIIINVAG